MILGGGSLVVGALFGFPPDHGLYHRFVEPVFAAAGTEAHAIGVGTILGLAVVATAIASLGIWGLARAWYKEGDSPVPAQVADRFRGLYTLVLEKYRVDEVYDAVFVEGLKRLCHRLWGVDAKGVDGVVNGTGWLTLTMSRLSAAFDFRGVDGLVNLIADVIQGGSGALRRVQTGVLQNYLLAMATGIFVIVSVLYFF
jgi:NADH-quinone oxidoreductase subunit L